jgi:hypothetical protein
MSTRFLQDFVSNTKRYQTQLFCLAASCFYLLGGPPQEAKASTPERAPDNAKNILNDVNARMRGCSSKSMLDTLSEKRNTAVAKLFYSATESPLLVGTDACPGTPVPAGASFADADTTVGANNTISQLNTCIPFPAMWGPDKIYKIVLPAPASRPSCTITATPQASYDLGVYLITPSGQGCPAGTLNSNTNCVTGKDNGLIGVAEQITTAQMNTLAAGTYFVFIDSFYCGNDLSECRTPGSGANECTSGRPECWHGTYTLNISNCGMLSPTAAAVTVGGRVLSSDGRGISQAKVSVVLPSGESRSVITNPFGFYHFDDMAVGQAYVFQVDHKQYQFPSGAQLITVNDTIQNLDFVAAGSDRPQNTKH